MNILLSVFVILFVFGLPETNCTNVQKENLIPGCCSFPCDNSGICLPSGPNGTEFVCDCFQTGYYGNRCDIPYLSTRIKNFLRPSKATVHWLLSNWKFQPLWSFVNHFDFLHDRVMRYVYLSRADFIDSLARFDSDHDHVTLDAAFNKSIYARVMPPVPNDCPTPLGVVGRKELPSIEELEKLFVRSKFKPSSRGTNVLFAFFAQHFTHQFFKTDWDKGMPFTTTFGHGIDLTHIYGDDLEAQRQLRSFKDGRMKMQTINGEEWPPFVTEANVVMLYPPHIPKEKQFAMGNGFFSMLPGLLMFNAIWLREHNRVAGILKGAFPSWTDERLFHTSRHILVAETIKIVIEEYVQHLSGYNLKLTFQPELLEGRPFQFQNKISAEFNLLYRWHALMPSSLTFADTEFDLKDLVYRPELAPEVGMRQFAGSLALTQAGEITHGNHAQTTIKVMRKIIEQGRQLKLQSFNNYRRYFQLEPYTSFEELVGPEHPELAVKLKLLYGDDVEALEFVPGLYLEKRRPQGMFGETIVEMGAPASVTGLMSNPICSPKFWRPSTFGGEIGVEIIKKSNLKNLFCQNLQKDGKQLDCPFIGFALPSTTRDTTATSTGQYAKQTASTSQLEL